MENAILLVDDEEELLDALELHLERSGYEVLKADSGKSAIEAVKKYSPSLIITKTGFPDMSGVDLLKNARNESPDIEVILISDERDTSSKAECLALDASDFLYKPISSEVLKVAIQRALKRRQERKKLRDYERKLEAARKTSLNSQQFFDEMPCYISIQDKNFRITRTNKWFKKDFGDQLGARCYNVYKHRTEPCRPCPVMKTFKDGQYYQTEEVVTSKRGEQFNIFTWTAPIYDSNGEIREVMEMSTNITQIRKLQDNLTSLGLMIGSMSHGIRGMLMGLDGGIYRLESGLKKEDKSKVHDALEVVKDLTDRIKKMVINILYYTKERKVNSVKTDTDSFFKDVLKLLLPKAKKHNIELNYKSDDSSGHFEIDTETMSSAIVNIVENSIDACLYDNSKKDSYHVDLIIKGGRDSITLNVADNGVGMDQATRENIFTLFFSSKGHRGTGLGLFIANQIIEKHGGTIEVSSNPGEGSNFKIIIPRILPENTKKINSDITEFSTVMKQ